MRKRLYSGDHPDLADGLFNLADLLMHFGSLCQCRRNPLIASIATNEESKRTDRPSLVTRLCETPTSLIQETWSVDLTDFLFIDLIVDLSGLGNLTCCV